MTTLPTTIDIAAISDTGRVREHNEDAVWFGDGFFRSGFRSRRVVEPEIDGLLLAVADGVGGAAAGEVASKWVCEQMAALIAGIHGEERAVLEARLKRTASRVNDELVRQGDRRPGRRGMATTFTGVLFSASWSCWLNAGDSRFYCARNGELSQVSRDHTLREERGDPSIPGNIITNCFGTPDEFYLDVGSLDPFSCDAFLLCSDGLSDYADMARVAGILAELPSPPPDDETAAYLEPAARDILDSALAGGGGDNVTLLIARPHHA
jgi:PPM family protein phosphatase